jgi:hypothetical protein
VSEDFAPLFLRIILGLDSNTHSLREMLRKSDEGLKFNVIGCAIYPSAALCNHSCDPNMFRATHGNHTVHRLVLLKYFAPIFYYKNMLGIK